MFWPMKKSLLLFSFLSASVLAGVSFSCSEQLQDAEARFSSGCSEFMLAEVKRAFEADLARVSQTRVDEGFDDDKVLDPGWIVPEWNAIAFCNGGSDTSVI